jgi:hypothetical protein
MRRKNTQISKIRNEKGEITKNTKEIQGIIRDYFENLYSNTLENLEEMDKFLDTYDHPKLNQDKWMELENIILSEVSLAQKTKNRMFSLICGH